MINLLLKTLGFTAFLSGEPTQFGWLAGALQRVIQTVTILVLATLATYGIATVSRSLIDDYQVKSDIERMVELRGLGDDIESAVNALEAELGGTVHFSVPQSTPEQGYSVLVGVANQPPVVRKNPCDRELTAPLPNAVCLFRVRRLFPSVPLTANLVAFEFPGTAYMLPELVISAAKIANRDIEFTRARADKVRRTVENIIGDRLFLPSNSSVLWGRRLNGPIQLITFLLASAALILIALAYVNSVSQNWAVRLVKNVSLAQPSRGGPPLPRLPGENTDLGPREPSKFPHPVIPGGPAQTEPGSAKGVEASEGEQGEPATEVVLGLIGEYPTPWTEEFLKDPPLDLSDARQTAEYYDVVAKQVQRDSEVFGVRIDPPVLRFRSAATRAVANTGDTSILPSFLEAQKNSILSFYEARSSLVRFLLWSIPTIGFIGTILGVSSALSSTIGLQSARELVAGFAQSAVSASMGMAFDTTLVALVLAVVVMLAYHCLQGAEERLTVLERNRAEAEIMEISKAIRRPGGPADLAQQLISLGVNTEYLIRDLKLFQTTGPQLANVIQALADRNTELQALDREWLHERRGRSRRGMGVVGVVGIVLVLVLAFEGYLGQSIQSWVEMAVNWVVGRFGEG